MAPSRTVFAIFIRFGPIWPGLADQTRHRAPPIAAPQSRRRGRRSHPGSRAGRLVGPDARPGQHPDWAADNAPRTLASLIHDWMWADLKRQLDDVTHVNLIDRHPTREIAVQVQSNERLSYLLRVKLHHLDGRTSSYQTQSVIDFELQGVTPSFPGFGETRLQVGYEWDKDARTMGDPVISLRDGRDKIIWVHSLGEQEGEADGGTITRPPKPRPTLPTLGVSAAESDDSTGTEET